MKKRELLEKYIECMQSGDNVALADLFDEHGVLHDSSQMKIGNDTMHLEGKMAVEMMFHNRFGFNGGPFPITSVAYKSEDTVWYFFGCRGQIIPVCAILSELSDSGLIQRLNIYPL